MRRRRFFHDHGLTIALVALTLLCLVGHAWSGYRVWTDERAEDGLIAGTALEYLASAHFLSSLFENWESEFLQMAAYVLLTIALFQRGSGDSKDPDGRAESVDEDPREHAHDPGVPWPVRRGGLVLRLYSASLSLALAALFAASFVLHLCASMRHARENPGIDGPPASAWAMLGRAQFWFESFQNWQSEFLSIGVLVVFSIFLRQKGSPESKPVHFPHARTGKE